MIAIPVLRADTLFRELATKVLFFLEIFRPVPEINMGDLHFLKRWPAEVFLAVSGREITILSLLTLRR